MNCAINSIKMKKIGYLLLILFVFFIYGCSKEEAPLTGKITAITYKVEEIESTEDTAKEERENITTVRLCHDTDNGVVRWVNGSIFGFYSNATRFEFTDYCISNNYLMEFYCENKIAMQKVFFCRHGCINGHCA